MEINNSLNHWKNHSTEFRTKRLELSSKIVNLYRVRRHVQYVPIRRCEYNYEEDFTKLRVDFLLKRIDEDKMYQKVKKLIKGKKRKLKT